MIINKNKAIKLTKVIHSMKAQDIPLNQLLLGVNGITVQTVEDAIQRKLNG